MGKLVKLNPSELKVLRQIDERMISYNVEMTEVTGGTFWKAYTEAQVDGTEEFPVIKDWSNMGNLQQWYDPIDTTNPRLIKLAKDLGKAWVRVSGTWANKTYYDFDGHTNGQVPEGYQNLLTKEQWTNLLDFVKAKMVNYLFLLQTVRVTTVRTNHGIRHRQKCLWIIVLSMVFRFQQRSLQMNQT